MISKRRVNVCLVLVGLLLAACYPQPTTPTAQPAPTATATMPPAPSPSPQAPTPEPTATPQPPPELPQAALAARQALSASLEVPVEEIEIVAYERREWPDACLGLAREGEMCAQVITPGWRVVLSVQGKQYVFRTDEDGQVVRPEDPGDLLGGGEPEILVQGTFEGVAGHEGAGTVTILPLPDGGALLRFENFAVTEGPDLYVYLVQAADPVASADFGTYVDLGLLESNVGNQEYVIPADVDVNQYQSVVIYCLAYDVLFAMATLGS